MTIASAITAAQGRVADCYTAISNKGGTLPATQNLANMPTAIASIPSGGGISNINNNYVLKTNGDIELLSKNGFTLEADASDVSTSLEAAYSSNTNIQKVNLGYLISVSTQNAFKQTFKSCTNLVQINAKSLQSISGEYAFRECFNNCTNLTDVNLEELLLSGEYGLYSAFQKCTSLKNVYFNKLTNIQYSYSLFGTFNQCTALENVYFYSLTTSSFGSYKNQFNSMLTSTGSSVTHTLHFPSNLSSKISTLTGYPLFGGTSGYVVCAFDLPSTQ